MTYPGALLSSSWRRPFFSSTGTRSSAPERMKASDSSASRYRGSPLSVFRVIAGRERLQTKPKGAFPLPESYDSVNEGPKPLRPGLVAIGTLIEPVPVTGLAANFSPIPLIAPPPFGRDTAGRLPAAPTDDVWLAS